MTYYLNIGTNLGNKKANIQAAIVAIEARLNGLCKVSPIFESEPWGFDSENTFFNVGVAIDSELAPLSVLSELQDIEKSLGSLSHRNADGSYRDRIIDIDIIAIDNLIISNPKLSVPHPHLHERNFVAIPLAQLAPDWMHPILNITASEIARKFDATFNYN